MGEADRENGEPAEKETGAGAARGIGRSEESKGSEGGARMPEPTTDVGEPAEGAEDGSEARVGEPANDVGEASSKTSTGTSETDEWSREA